MKRIQSVQSTAARLIRLPLSLDGAWSHLTNSAQRTLTFNTSVSYIRERSLSACRICVHDRVEHGLDSSTDWIGLGRKFLTTIYNIILQDLNNAATDAAKNSLMYEFIA